MNWDAFEQDMKSIILFAIIFVIAITIVIWGIIWFFIKSAVRASVKEALETTVVTVQICDIANGLIFYTKEHNAPNVYHTNLNNNKGQTGEIHRDMPFLE